MSGWGLQHSGLFNHTWDDSLLFWYILDGLRPPTTYHKRFDHQKRRLHEISIIGLHIIYNQISYCGFWIGIYPLGSSNMAGKSCQMKLVLWEHHYEINVDFTGSPAWLLKSRGSIDETCGFYKQERGMSSIVFSSVLDIDSFWGPIRRTLRDGGTCMSMYCTFYAKLLFSGRLCAHVVISLSLFLG